MPPKNRHAGNSSPPGDLISHLSCIGVEILTDGEQSQRAIGEQPPPCSSPESHRCPCASATLTKAMGRGRRRARRSNVSLLLLLLLLFHQSIHTDLASGPRHTVLVREGGKGSPTAVGRVVSDGHLCSLSSPHASKTETFCA